MTAKQENEKLEYSKRLDRVEEFLYYGNGDSMKTFMGEQREFMSDTKSMLNEVKETVKIIPAINTSIQLHHATLHFSNLIKSPKFWSLFIVGIFVIDELARYVPAILNLAFVAAGIHFQLPLVGGFS